MLRYLLRRILISIPVLIAITVIVFGLTVVKVSRQDSNGNPPSAEAKP